MRIYPHARIPPEAVLAGEWTTGPDTSPVGDHLPHLVGAGGAFASSAPARFLPRLAPVMRGVGRKALRVSSGWPLVGAGAG